MSRTANPPPGDPPPLFAASRLIPVGFFLAAVLLRSRHLDWGLPDLEEEAYPLKKAFEMCGWGTGAVQFDPQTAGWPSLSFYIHMMLQHLQFGLGRLTGAYADRGDFFLLKTDMTSLAIWARWLGVLAAAGVTAVGARIGGRLAGRTGGLLAGLALLASPMLARHAQLITPDILLTVFAALALDRMIAVAERGRLRDYLGSAIWMGLGASVKYTPVFLAPALVVAHLLGPQQEPARRWWRRWGDRRLWLAAGLCALVFAATSPYLLLDPDVVARDVGLQMEHLQGGHFGHESQRPGLLFYLVDVLGPGLGWPCFVLGVGGLLTAAWRRRGRWLVLAAAFLAYYLICSFWQTRFERYLLPALLPLAVGVGGAWLELADRLAPVRRNLVPAAAVVLALAVALPGAMATAEYLADQGRPSTLERSRDWIMTRLKDQDPYLAMEMLTPSLPRRKQLALRLADPALPHLSPAQQERYLDLDPLAVVYLPFYSTLPRAGAFYYDLRHFLAYDYVVTSSAVRGRFERSPDLYPAQAQFYADLERHTSAAEVFAPDDGGRGPVIRLYRITDETRAAVARDKPPLTAEDFRRAAADVIGSHFQDFVRTVAEHAAARGAVAVAATYYQPLYATTPPDQRAAILPAYAAACAEAGRWREAEPLLQRWMEQDPQDPRPVGYLGVVAARLGRPLEGADLLARCEAMAEAIGTPAGRELARWARARLADPAPAGAGPDQETTSPTTKEAGR